MWGTMCVVKVGTVYLCVYYGGYMGLDESKGPLRRFGGLSLP